MPIFSNQNAISDDYISKKMHANEAFNDMALLAQVVNGNEQAFYTLYQHYHLNVFHYLLSVVRHKQTAEDILQDVFVVLWKSAGSFRGDAKLKTWLLRVAHNKAMDSFRKSKNETELNEYFIGNTDEPLEAQMIRSQQAEQLDNALAQLKPTQRAVLDLVFKRALSYREAAQVMSCPVGTIKSRVNYALIRMRKLMPADTNNKNEHNNE